MTNIQMSSDWLRVALLLSEILLSFGLFTWLVLNSCKDESNNNKEDEGQVKVEDIVWSCWMFLKVFILDGKTEQCWCYSDYVALKNDRTPNAHMKFYLIQTNFNI